MPSVLPEASGVVLRGAIQLSSNEHSFGWYSRKPNLPCLACWNEALDDQSIGTAQCSHGQGYFPEALDYRLVKFFRDPSAEVRVLSLILFSRSHGNELERAGLVANWRMIRNLIRLGSAWQALCALAGDSAEATEDGSAPVKVEAVRQLAMRRTKIFSRKLQERS